MSQLSDEEKTDPTFFKINNFTTLLEQRPFSGTKFLMQCEVHCQKFKYSISYIHKKRLKISRKMPIDMSLVKVYKHVSLINVH